MTGDLLRVSGLDVGYRTQAGSFQAVHDLSFSLRPGEILGIVGESGCGKSTLSAALLGLLPPNGRLTAGTIEFKGRDLARLHQEELRRLRGTEIGAIFQDPLTSLCPTFRVAAHMIDAQRAHQRTGRAELRRRAIEMLERVGIPDAAQRIDDYPHEFSGGMRQRIMIATALLLEPSLLIADEPTSALDVTLEAQIVVLLKRLRAERGTAIILVTHDLGVVARTCDRVLVMYAGRAVEEADVASLFARPRHPYTQALLAAIPSRSHRGSALATIPGRVPSLLELPPGCKFAPRCPYVMDVCRGEEPGYVAPGDNGARVRCVLA